ncbi:hypothetical protein QGN29_02010 [Temperatibacter marinus]|uniref:Secreted protein n=1 Tax=Temperatibacter marinus TaxID=1456591 RepID=A0AA52HAV8_9PROT|nr:hypothetical protein [Temperatibacter marinus]WND03140.1 hypothetical protein QGN29_02010 [Temperatibacter marinus]
MTSKSLIILSILGVFTNLPAAKAEESHAIFFNQLKKICGHSYEGTVVASNESDEKWRQSKLIIHAPACTADMTKQIRIPLHVGEDKSRTWIITKSATGLSLKHDHRHKDGTPDAVSMYGGHTTTKGSPTSQDFPVDDFSKALFIKEGLKQSTTNVWTLTLNSKGRLSYRLSRPGREFEVSFDLNKPL